MALIFAFCLPVSASAGPADVVHLDLSGAAVQRGRNVFMAVCNQCHGLKYLIDGLHPNDITPTISPEDSKSAFGVEPPDLSLMALARGRRLHL